MAWEGRHILWHSGKLAELAHLVYMSVVPEFQNEWNITNAQVYQSQSEFLYQQDF